MNERSLTGRDHAPQSPWSYEDQEEALRAGFASVTDWAMWKMAKEMLPDIERRLKLLEDLQANDSENATWKAINAGEENT